MGNTVLIMRTCDKNMRSHGGFQWPQSGPVVAPDWQPTEECGNGLHGFLWGEGNGELADWSETAIWLVAKVDAATVIDLDGKVKFPSADVVYCGDLHGAAEYIAANGGAGRKIIGGTATAGYAGTATAGDRGTATAGYRGTATAGDRGDCDCRGCGDCDCRDRRRYFDSLLERETLQKSDRRDS